MKNQNTLSEGPEQNLVFYPTRLRMLLGFAGSFAFVACGLWMALSSGDVWHISIGAVCIAFFSLCGLIPFLLLVRPGPILIVNEEGMQQRNPLLNVFVAWEEIAAIIPLKGRNGYLNVYLSESGKQTFSARYPRLWRISRAFGELPALSFSQLLLPLPAQQVSKAIQERYQRQIDQYGIVIR